MADSVLTLAPDIALTTDWLGHPVAINLNPKIGAIKLTDSELLALVELMSDGPRGDGQESSDTPISQDVIHRLLNDHVIDSCLSQDQQLYSASMIEAYIASRRVPSTVVDVVASLASVGQHTSVLDIGCGPGSLSVQLAKRSTRVTAIDINADFISEVAKEALRNDVYVETVRVSGNKLSLAPRRFNVVIACQSFHWLEPTRASEGISRHVQSDGHFVAIETKLALHKDHVMRRHFNIGSYTHDEAISECARHAISYAHMFAALRHDNLRLLSAVVVDETRQFDRDFARAYLFDRNISAAMPESASTADAILATIFSESVGELGHCYWLIAVFGPNGKATRDIRHNSVVNTVISI